MDTFFKEIHYTLLYSWCKNQIQKDNFSERETVWLKEISYTIGTNQIILSFWKDSNMVELQILDTTTKDKSFYMHFQFINFLQSIILINEFTSYINKMINNRKVLIVCSCGITSSLFADNLKHAVSKNNLNYSIDAINLHSLENVASQYDCICLAPQIRHVLSNLTGQTRKKTLPIDSAIFATNNSNALLFNLNKKMEEMKL